MERATIPVVEFVKDGIVDVRGCREGECAVVTGVSFDVEGCGGGERTAVGGEGGEGESDRVGMGVNGVELVVIVLCATATTVGMLDRGIAVESECTVAVLKVSIETGIGFNVLIGMMLGCGGDD